MCNEPEENEQRTRQDETDKPIKVELQLSMRAQEKQQRDGEGGDNQLNSESRVDDLDGQVMRHARRRCIIKQCQCLGAGM